MFPLTGNLASKAVELVSKTSVPPNDLAEKFHKLSSITAYKVFNRRPICQNLNDVLAHREWFVEAPEPHLGRPRLFADYEKPIIVVDNFYDDPYGVRQHALECRYFQYGENWYVTSKLETSPENTLLNSDEIHRALEEICAVPIENDDEHWSQRPWNGAFHYKPSEPFGLSSSIHTHQPSDIWYGYNGIVYLNPPGTYPPRHGVSIWRHKKSGRCVSATKIFATDLHNFDLVYRVEGRFNRLILLRSDVWHLGESGFGTKIDDSRLFQTFFFEIKGKYEDVERQANATGSQT